MPIRSTLTAGALLWGLLRFALLAVLFFICFALGGSIVSPALPTLTPEPGPLPLMPALFVISAASALVVALMILSSRWHGWKLIIVMSATYYVAVTFLMQIEAWYFLYGLTIGPQLMPLLFLQGVPVALLFVPLAVVILGRARQPATSVEQPRIVAMPWFEWAWKLPLIAAAYLALYLGAGYFIAWQNPEVRAFYGQPGEVLPFLAQTANILANDPWLMPFQILRAMIWVACALPILRGSRWPLWATALVVGLMFSVPQNVGHILPNSLIPLNSVRLSHLVETVSSTFVFGLIVSWLLYPKYGEARASQPRIRPIQQRLPS